VRPINDKIPGATPGKAAADPITLSSRNGRRSDASQKSHNITGFVGYMTHESGATAFMVH
jgi:hypothetical protein